MEVCYTVRVMHTLIPIDSPYFISGSGLDVPPSWNAIFGNDNPLVLEIGCGIGDFAVHMAERHPDWNFIALDYYNKGCLKTCKRAELHGVGNIRVIRDEALSFVERCIPRSSLRALYINCPDPWPKRRHRKRRLVQEGFVDFIRPYLRDGADFFFATDFDDYGVDVATMMASRSGFANALSPDLWRHDIEGYQRTKYMRKFMAEGKRIYFVHYRTLPVESEGLS